MNTLFIVPLPLLKQLGLYLIWKKLWYLLLWQQHCLMRIGHCADGRLEVIIPKISPIIIPKGFTYYSFQKENYSQDSHLLFLSQINVTTAWWTCNTYNNTQHTENSYLPLYWSIRKDSIYSCRAKSKFAPKLFARSENIHSPSADEGWISRIWWKALTQVSNSEVYWLHYTVQNGLLPETIRPLSGNSFTHT